MLKKLLFVFAGDFSIWAACAFGKTARPRRLRRRRPPVAQAPTFMVFFDWDSSRLFAGFSQCDHPGGPRPSGPPVTARVTAKPAHTPVYGPRPGKLQYGPVASARANAVKNELVRQGVPADRHRRSSAKGESSSLLVADRRPTCARPQKPPRRDT